MKTTIIKITSVFIMSLITSLASAKVNLADYDGKNFLVGSGSGMCAQHIELGFGNVIHVTNVVSEEQDRNFITQNGHDKYCGINGKYGGCKKQTEAYTCDLESGACATFDEVSLWLLPDGNISVSPYGGAFFKMYPSSYWNYYNCN